MFAQEQLLHELGDQRTNRVMEQFSRFALLPDSVIDQLASQALSEIWGRGNFALKKYLGVQVPWSIQQGLWTSNDTQFYVTAGNLQTRYGTPLYLAFERNRNPAATAPYVLVFAGTNISAPSLPTAPEIPPAPQIPCGGEIVMMHDHILGENAGRVSMLGQTPKVAQMCAVSGSIQWSINRGLALPYWYFGKMDLLVPLYLRTREDITLAPDLVAPVQVNRDNLLVRTVLPPEAPYANARVAVTRGDRLPHWMLDTWKEFSVSATAEQVDDPEGRSEVH